MSSSMTPEHKLLVQNFILRKIDFPELERDFSATIDEGYLLNELTGVATSKDGEALECLIALAYRIGFTDSIGRLLSKLLIENWHEEHEEIARILQFKVKILESLDDLTKAIALKFDYMIERGNYEPFVIKCMHAIADLHTEASTSKLKELANSKDPIIKKAAQYQLERLERKEPEPLVS